MRVIKSRKMRWAAHVARMEKINAYSILVGKPEGIRPLGRHRRREENNNTCYRNMMGGCGQYACGTG
jgi:hypothetical protein